MIREKKHISEEHVDFLVTNWARLQGAFSIWEGRKDIGSLTNEVADGETLLKRTTTGELHRFVSTATVAVYYQHPRRGLLRLIENRQVFFKEGNYNHTDKRQLPWVSEKIIRAEDRTVAARRAVKEEIGLTLPLERFEFLREEKFVQGETVDPTYIPSYPIPTTNTLPRFSVHLTDEEFIEKGYREDQTTKLPTGLEGKMTYFVWQEV